MRKADSTQLYLITINIVVIIIIIIITTIRAKDWASKADSHPALPPGRIQTRLHLRDVDLQKQLYSQSGNEENELHIRPSKIQSTIHKEEGNKEDKKSDILKNWSDSERKGEQTGNEKNIVKGLRKDEKLSNEKNVVKGLRKVNLQHPVFSQKLLEEARERREETPPIETCLDNLNGMQCMMMIILKK